MVSLAIFWLQIDSFSGQKRGFGSVKLLRTVGFSSPLAAKNALLPTLLRTLRSLANRWSTVKKNAKCLSVLAFFNQAGINYQWHCYFLFSYTKLLHLYTLHETFKLYFMNISPILFDLHLGIVALKTI